MRRVAHLVGLLCVLAFVVMLVGCGSRNGVLEGPTLRAAGNPPANKIAFHNPGAGADRSRAEIFTMDGDGSGAVQLTAGKSQGGNTRPTWRPDGTKLCFVSSRPNSLGIGHLYVMNPDGSGQARLLTNDTGFEDMPDWSPDGTRVAYSWSATGVPSRLHIQDLATGVEADLHPVPGLVDSSPAWCPSGTMIVLRCSSQGNPASGLYVVQADGSGASRILPGEDLYAPSWSPLGGQIAYSKGGDIYVIPVDPATGAPTGPGTNVTNSSATYDDWPSWSSDGAWLVFESMAQTPKATTWRICRVSVSGGASTALGNGFDPDWCPVP